MSDTENTITELKELVEVVRTLEPDVQSEIAPALRRLIATLEQRYRTLALIKTSLDQLRVDVKYLVFDLESTRSERDEYKAKWENR